MDTRKLASEMRAEAALLYRKALALEAAADALIGAEPPPEKPTGARAEQEAAERHGDPAPYGYKADGTPRKRPAPSKENLAKAQAARWHRKSIEQRPRRETRLRVLSQTAPTERELEDREVAHVTAEG